MQHPDPHLASQTPMQWRETPSSAGSSQHGLAPRRASRLSGGATLLDLPREVIRLICLEVYDPLELSQQDRLTWGIFSTVDMHAERQLSLLSLIQFGSVCRKVRREARVVLFRCIRVPTLRHLEEVRGQRDGWGRFVRSIIIDLSMFDPDPDSSPSFTPNPAMPPALPVHPSSSGPAFLGPHTSTASVPPRTPYRTPRSCWSESALLVDMLRSLPALTHISIFADASDDSALALFFASLIPHPSLHDPPPPVWSPMSGTLSVTGSPADSTLRDGNADLCVSPGSTARCRPTGLMGTVSRTVYPPERGGHLPVGAHAFSHTGQSALYQTADPSALPSHSHPLPSLAQSRHHPIPFASRIKSFGWRQRASPPPGFRTYAQVSTFVSTLHLIRHAHRLSYLVLDADLDEMGAEDVFVVLRELGARAAPPGEQCERVSLVLCGPVRGWGREFVQGMVDAYKGVKELVVDRPLRKSMEVHQASVEHFITLVHPLSELPHLRLLQIGSYTWSAPAQQDIIAHLARAIPSLLVVGLLNEDCQTTWWGIWRRCDASSRFAEAFRAEMARGQEVGSGEADGAIQWVDSFQRVSTSGAQGSGHSAHTREAPEGGYKRAEAGEREGAGGEGEGEMYRFINDIRACILPLADGHLRALEEEADEHIRRTSSIVDMTILGGGATVGPTSSQNASGSCLPIWQQDGVSREERARSAARYSLAEYDEDGNEDDDDDGVDTVNLGVDQRRKSAAHRNGPMVEPALLPFVGVEEQRQDDGHVVTANDGTAISDGDSIGGPPGQAVLEGRGVKRAYFER